MAYHLFGRGLPESLWRQCDDEHTSSISPVLEFECGTKHDHGQSRTDLLREIPHDPAKMTYEAMRIQYKPICSNIMDIIETQVSEEDGQLVNFVSGVTTVTLHFKEIPQR